MVPNPPRTACRIPYAIAAALAVFILAPAATADRGEDLFGLCTQCHGADGAGDPIALAPAIAGLEEWYITAQLKAFKGGLRGLHPEDVGGLRMYPMSRALKTDEDIQAVAKYVSSLPRVTPPQTVEGDAAAGAASWTTCAACHGADGAGNQTMNAPRLAGTSDWYLVEALRKYKAGIRGGNPANTNAVMMRGMAMSLKDDQAIRDVVAHVLTLSK
jgi:cytochrome c oxidase subunit 2